MIERVLRRVVDHPITLSTAAILFFLWLAMSCLSGCADEPLTPEQQVVAQEFVKIERGDFIVTEHSVFFVTGKRVSEDRAGPRPGWAKALLYLEYCPGFNWNPKTTKDLARWSQVKHVSRGSDEYTATLNAWIDQQNCPR